MTDAVQVAIIGAIATAVSAIGVVLAASMSGVRDRSRVLHDGVASVLRERLVLRDEQIRDLELENAQLRALLEWRERRDGPAS